MEQPLTADSKTRRDGMTSARQPVQRIFGMRLQSLANIGVAILMSSALLMAPAGAGSEEVVQTAGGVSYVSGGVGTDSIDRLRSLAKDFNLKLVFALKSGDYVSDVKVTIGDAAGKTLLDTASEGPWFLAKLPAGSYRISATLAGNTVKRNIALDAAKLKVIDFRWASD
jgi:hypothetical protein